MNYYIATDKFGNYDLAHHGIKGQRWGIRRYQNEDGSLTNAGKKKYSSKYKKAMISYQKDQVRASKKIYIDSYNKTAEEYNSTKLNEYNSKHKPTDPDYFEEYEKQFRRDWIQNYNRSLMDFSRNNKNFKRGKMIAEKYGLYDFDDLAKDNKAFIDRMIESNYMLTPEETKNKKIH